MVLLSIASLQSLPGQQALSPTILFQVPEGKLNETSPFNFWNSTGELLPSCLSYYVFYLVIHTETFRLMLQLLSFRKSFEKWH